MVHELQVLRVVEETADSRSFVLDVPEALQSRFRYRAGQFLTFHVRVGGEELARCYSLSSAPETDAQPKVTVKRVAEGRVSNWFVDEVSEGDTLQVAEPAGLFVLRDSDAPLLLFGAGSGVTPIMSIVQSSLVSTGRRIKLVYANQDRKSVIFDKALGDLARNHERRLEVVHHLDVDRGFLDEAGARGHVAGWESSHVYICGPTPFMDVVEAAVLGLGVDGDRVLIERFTAPEDDGAPAAVVSGAVQAELTVHLDGETHRISCKPDETILEALKRSDLMPPFACEDGYCGTCVATRLSGEVEMRVNDVLSRSDVARGMILTCQAVPISSACEVRYED